MSTNNSDSITIIGGADGPTSIFISGSLPLTIIKVILMLLIVGVLYIIINKKSRK